MIIKISFLYILNPIRDLTQTAKFWAEQRVTKKI